MQASFDGARKNLAKDFNDMAHTNLSFAQKIIMERMRESMVGLLCMYDDQAEDCHCLIDVVPLEEIE